MADSKLLYFPYMNVPSSPWTIQSILYWDSVGLILPPRTDNEPNPHDEFTQDLIDAKLIEKVRPRKYTERAPKFDEKLINLFEQKGFDLKARRRSFANGNFVPVHMEKFGFESFHYLVQQKLATQEPWPWYHIEPLAAKMIMTYLARVIGNASEFTPSTDHKKNLDLRLNKKWVDPNLMDIRRSLIEDLIPYPLSVDLARIRNFKAKYHDELVSFRNLIEQHSLQLGSQKKKYRDDQRELMIQEIEDKREKILRELNASRFPKIVFGSIATLAAAAIGFNTENPYLGLIPLAAAAYAAFEGYDRQHLIDKDYAYLALLEKKIA